MHERSATVSYRIRFDEAGPSGAARPSLYLRLAQDVAWIHSERLGFTRAWYEARGIAWLVRAVSLDVGSGARFGEEVAVTTRVVGFRRIWARRRTDVRKDDSLVASVVTDWILTDDRGRPARIPEIIARRVPGEGRMIEAIRVADPPARPPDVEVIGDVRFSELDPLTHINNAAYLDRVLDMGARIHGAGQADDEVGRSIAIEYAAAAGPGDRIVESAWALEAGGYAYRMSLLDRGPILKAVLTVRHRTD